MTIKDGYSSKPTHIKIGARNEDGQRMAEFWLDQTGMKWWSRGHKQVPASEARANEIVSVDQNGKKFVTREHYIEIEGRETLAYMTLDELLDLRDECNRVIKELTK